MFKGAIENIKITLEKELVVEGFFETSITSICRHVTKHYPEILYGFLRTTRPVMVRERWTDGNGNDLPLKVLVADDQFWWFGPTATATDDWNLWFTLELHNRRFRLVVK